MKEDGDSCECITTVSSDAGDTAVAAAPRISRDIKRITKQVIVLATLRYISACLLCKGVKIFY